MTLANLYAELAWLPPAPPDFRSQVRAVLEDREGPPGPAIIRLASHALSEGQLDKLASAIDELTRRSADLKPLQRFRLGLVGTGTLDLLVPALVGSAARHGVLLECVRGEYGQIAQEALNPDSKINRARCDAVLLAIDHRSLPIPSGLSERSGCVESSVQFFDMIRAGFRKNGGAVSIVQTLPAPPETLFGSFDRRAAASMRSILDTINRELMDALEDTPDLVLDVAALAETVGLSEWHSPRQWNFAKLPFSASYARLYADHVARLIGAIRGTTRRCLILDLDNTVWGGVIGDDGPDGIRIAQGDADGEAYLDVQRAALMLRERGVALAVCSKNTDETARAVFKDHPDMLLREQHIAVFQANWNDKAANIRAIAEELSLGLSSMVFLDDNPFERDLIRTLLPEVAVPELPDDPALYARTLLAAGYFEAIAFTEEDRNRAGFYQNSARRLALQGQAGDIDAYLASLDTQVHFAPFDKAGRERIAQLINKSNQFNLTTRRYTEAELASVEADEETFTLQVRLADKFGDSGMISVLIARPAEPSEWEIDTWLMSCRVLGRKVEDMVLSELAAQARTRGVQRLIGLYRPTDRNGIVKDHYARLGFTQIEVQPDGTSRWSLDLATEVAAPAILRRVDAGDGASAGGSVSTGSLGLT